jgi:hypothetical protein
VIDFVDVAQIASGGAAVAAALIAAVAAMVAAKQLRSQAKSQELSAVMSTNDLWRRVQESTRGMVTIGRETIAAIESAHAAIDPSARSVVDRNATATDLQLPAPFILGALQTLGVADVADAANTEQAYRKAMEARGRVVGFTLASLANIARGANPEAPRIADDLRAMRRSVEEYVNVLNEVAELYDADLIDRRLFLGKRHVALIQQAYCAEPYILWRNSSYSGRWGLRLLSIGEEARAYHRKQVLQQSAVRSRVDPVEYALQPGYVGYSSALGWMVGPGRVSSNRFAAWWSERRARSGLGGAFTATAKRRQNSSIQHMPRTAGSGHVATAGVPGQRWEDLLTDPTLLAGDVRIIRTGTV